MRAASRRVETIARIAASRVGVALAEQEVALHDRVTTVRPPEDSEGPLVMERGLLVGEVADRPLGRPPAVVDGSIDFTERGALAKWWASSAEPWAESP